jgi:hypothetical protein
MQQIKQNGLLAVVINLEYLRMFLSIIISIQHTSIICTETYIFTFQNATDNSPSVKECMKCFFSLIMTNVKDIQSTVTSKRQIYLITSKVLTILELELTSCSLYFRMSEQLMLQMVCYWYTITPLAASISSNVCLPLQASLHKVAPALHLTSLHRVQNAQSCVGQP